MSSFPLAALSVKAPEQQPDILSQYSKAIQLRSLMAQQALIPGQQQIQQQQITSGQQENQKNAIALQDQQATTKAMQQWDGQDLNELPSLILKNGGSANAVFSTKNSIVTYQKNLQDMTKEQLDNESTKNDYFAQLLDNVKSLPADQQPTAFESAKQQGVEKGYLTAQQAQGIAYQSPQQLDLLEKTFLGHGKAVDAALKGQQEATSAQEQETSQATQQHTEAETTLLKQFGNSDSQQARYLGIQEKLNQKQPLTPEEQAFSKAYEKNKTLVPVANFNLQNSGATGAGGQPSAIAKGLADGTMKWQDVVSARTPMSVKQALLSEVKSIKPDYNSGDFALEQGVKKEFTSGDAAKSLTAFNTAIEHANQLRTATDALDNGNVIALNKVGNALGYQFGSDKTTNFNVIKNALSGEISKVFKGGGATDAEIASVQKPFDSANSPTQLKGAIDQAVALMNSKRSALQQQYQQGVNAKPNFGSSSFTPPAGAPTATGPDGHKIVAVGGKWLDAQTGAPIQ